VSAPFPKIKNGDFIFGRPLSFEIKLGVFFMEYNQNQSMEYDPDKRKLLSALAHGSIFISALGISIGIPIAILLVSDDPVVKENAKESLNFHFNVWLYGLIFGALAVILIGLPFLGLLLLASWVLPILAIIQVFGNPNQSYRYPFIFRLL
jgi:uncharacterized Tic20 family protein